MQTISATDASRRFSALLDAIEAGETITVTRGNRPIAEIRPARQHTGRDLRMTLRDVAPPDDQFTADINEAMGRLTSEEVNPWADA